MAQDLNASDITGCFSNRSTLIRRGAYEEASRMDTDSEICSALIGSVRNETDNKNKILVCEALAQHGKENIAAQTELSKIMYREGEIEEVRLAAARAFYEAGGNAQQMVSLVVLCLRSPKYGTRNEALSVLASLGPAASMSAPFLAMIGCNPNEIEDFRSRALSTIGEMGKEARHVSPTIAQLLVVEKSALLLMDALSTLERIGVTKEAIPQLVAALNYRDPDTQQIRNRCPCFLFAGGLDMHEMVAELLGTLGPEAVTAIPTLEELLTRPLTAEEARDRLEPLPPVRRARGLGARIAQEEHARALAEREKQIRLTSEGAKEAACRALELIKGVRSENSSVEEVE